MTRHGGCGAPLAAGDPESVGDYVLESRLGAGGMGVVYLARSASGRRVAVKVIREKFAADAEFRARFRQEVAAARRVSGPFTAPVVDADPDAVFPWMATSYISGISLADRIKKAGPLSPGQLWLLVAGLAEALRDIHRVGVVHRDLKPANVLMSEDGPRVIDFGVSRAAESEVRTETGKVLGTPPFMAPEQFRAARDVGSAADVFALGSVLVHAATGHGPFDADSPYVVAYRVVHEAPNLEGVPEEMRPLLMRCLAKEAERRPSAEGILAALRSRRPERVRADSQDEPTAAPFHATRVLRRPTVALALSATVIVTVAASAGMWTRDPGQDSPRPAVRAPGHPSSPRSARQMFVPVGFKVVSPRPGQVKVTLSGKPPHGLIGYYVNVGDGQSWTPFGHDYTFHSPPKERTCVRVAGLVARSGEGMKPTAASSPPRRTCLIADGRDARPRP